MDSNLGDLSMTKMKLKWNKWKSEPTNVEKSTDELWLGVKCHLNLKLAGFPLNVLRRNIWLNYLRVKHCSSANYDNNTKSKQILNIRYDLWITRDKGQPMRWWG